MIIKDSQLTKIYKEIYYEGFYDEKSKQKNINSSSIINLESIKIKVEQLIIDYANEQFNIGAKKFSFNSKDNLINIELKLVSIIIKEYKIHELDKSFFESLNAIGHKLEEVLVKFISHMCNLTDNIIDEGVGKALTIIIGKVISNKFYNVHDSVLKGKRIDYSNEFSIENLINDLKKYY